MRWKYCILVFKHLELKEAFLCVSLHLGLTVHGFFQFRFPGKSADMVSSFHSLQSLSYPFRHPGSSVHVVTSVQQCQLLESLPTRWWWCEGGPWGRARRSEKRGPSKHQELSAHVLNQPAKSLGASLKFCFPVSFYLKLIFGSLSFLLPEGLKLDSRDPWGSLR